MADITKSSDAGIVNPEFLRPQTRQAVETIAAGDAVFINANGKLEKAGTTKGVIISGAFGVDYKFDGLAPREIVSGSYGEIYGAGSEWHYADSGLTIGRGVFPSATAGKLADAAVSSNDQPVGKAISATNVILSKGV
jgi:hypothetical protein